MAQASLSSTTSLFPQDMGKTPGGINRVAFNFTANKPGSLEAVNLV